MKYVRGTSFDGSTGYQWSTSNSDVIELAENDYNSTKAKAKGVGTSTITVIDENDNLYECTITVKGRSWSLPYNQIEKYVYNSGENIRINYKDPSGVRRNFTVSSSNENVVQAGWAGGDLLWIHYVGAGTASYGY